MKFIGRYYNISKRIFSDPDYLKTHSLEEISRARCFTCMNRLLYTGMLKIPRGIITFELITV